MDLVGLAFEVTKKCTYECSFCYNVRKSSKAYPQGELSLNQIRELFDKVLISVPTGSILLTGGDPLVRKDLEDIVKYFCSKKLKVGVATNGYFLDQERIRSLCDAGVSQFEVTLLSTNEVLHNTLSGNRNSYQRACEAIVNVKAMKRNVFVGFVATRDNIEDVSGVFDLAFALGADAFSFYRFVPTGNGLINRIELMPSISQINDAIEALDVKAGLYRMSVFLGIPIPRQQLRKKPLNIRITNCEGGSTKFTIDPLGNLRVCEQNPDIVGSLSDVNFLSLVLSKNVKDFRKLAKKAKGDCPLLCMT